MMTIAEANMTAKQVQATNQILEHVYRAHDALVDLRRHGISAEGVLMNPAFQISALKAAREELSKVIAIIELTKWERTA
jgi:hypothetical protein